MREAHSCFVVGLCPPPPLPLQPHPAHQLARGLGRQAAAALPSPREPHTAPTLPTAAALGDTGQVGAGQAHCGEHDALGAPVKVKRGIGSSGDKGLPHAAQHAPTRGAPAVHAGLDICFTGACGGIKLSRKSDGSSEEYIRGQVGSARGEDTGGSGGSEGRGSTGSAPAAHIGLR